MIGTQLSVNKANIYPLPILCHYISRSKSKIKWTIRIFFYLIYDSCFYLLSLLPQFLCIYSYIYSVFLKSKKDLVTYLYYFLIHDSFIFIYLIALFVVFLLPSFHFPKLYFCLTPSECHCGGCHLKLVMKQIKAFQMSHFELIDAMGDV